MEEINPQIKPSNNSVKTNEAPEETRRQLEAILKGIKIAREKGNLKAENDFYIKARELYRAVTGLDLLSEGEKGAREEILYEGATISKKSSISSETYLKRQISVFKSLQQSFGLKKAWDFLSQEDKQAYQNDISFFIADVRKKREEIIKNDQDISEEVFFNMMATGYMFSDIKKGVLGGIKIPIFMGEGVYKYRSLSRKEFDNLTLALQLFFNLISQQAVEDKINKKFISGRKRWQQRIRRKMRDLIAGEIRRIDDKQKEEETIELRIQNEVQSRLVSMEKEFAEEVKGKTREDAFRRLDQIEKSNKKADQTIKKELQKITKELTKEISQIGSEESKIKKIIKKQDNKNRNLHKRGAYIKFIKDKTPPGQESEKQEALKEE